MKITRHMVCLLNILDYIHHFFTMYCLISGDHTGVLIVKFVCGIKFYATEFNATFNPFVVSIWCIVRHCEFDFLAGTKYLGVGSTPLIFQTMWDATQLVKSPDPDFKTVYDQWLSVFSKSYNGTVKPQYAITNCSKWWVRANGVALL